MGVTDDGVWQIPATDDEPVMARLADLDLKAETKMDYWKKVEMSLIDEGWYEGKEKPGRRQGTTCSLAR